MDYDFSFKVERENGRFVLVITYPDGDRMISDESWADKDCAEAALDRYAPRFEGIVLAFAAQIEADSVEGGCVDKERLDTDGVDEG
jgi:hypothetical protein